MTSDWSITCIDNSWRLSAQRPTSTIWGFTFRDGLNLFPIRTSYQIQLERGHKDIYRNLNTCLHRSHRISISWLLVPEVKNRDVYVRVYVTICFREWKAARFWMDVYLHRNLLEMMKRHIFQFEFCLTYICNLRVTGPERVDTLPHFERQRWNWIQLSQSAVGK
jgi:hypothetical protein